MVRSVSQIVQDTMSRGLVVSLFIGDGHHARSIDLRQLGSAAPPETTHVRVLVHREGQRIRAGEVRRALGNRTLSMDQILATVENALVTHAFMTSKMHLPKSVTAEPAVSVRRLASASG